MSNTSAPVDEFVWRATWARIYRREAWVADNHDVSEQLQDLAHTPTASRFGYALGIGLICAFAAGKAVLADSLDPDFFWHIRVADQLLTQGIGPVVDHFSFMSNREPWTPFSWLGELLMKWTFDAGGLRAIVAAHALCSILFFYFLARACRESCRAHNAREGQLATFIACLCGAIFTLPYLSFRPVTMALALMAAMFFTLQRDRRVGDWRVWLLVPMTLVLTNLHLYVILWIALLWARWLGMALDAWNYLPSSAAQLQTENGLLHGPSARSHRVTPLNELVDLFPLRRQFTIAAACSLAALATPMLPGCIRNAIWFNSEDPMVQNRLVAEILPFYSGPLGAVLSLIVIATAALMLRALYNDPRETYAAPDARLHSPRTLGVAFGFEQLFSLALAIFFLLQMGRFATVFTLIAMPILASLLSQGSKSVFSRDSILDRVLVRFTLLCSLAFCVVQITFGFPRSSTGVDEWIARNADNLRYPTRAADYLLTNVEPVNGRVLNELTWGGYLIWRLNDRFQVFMDGRTLIYPATFWKHIYLGDENERIELLRAQRADAAILPTSNSHLASPLKALGWTAVYADDRAIILLPPRPLVTSTEAE